MPNSWVFQATKGDFEDYLKTTPQNYIEQGAILIDVNITGTLYNYRDLWFNASVGDRLFFYLRGDREFVGYGTIVEKFESDEPIPQRWHNHRSRFVVKVERILPMNTWRRKLCQGSIASDYGPWNRQFNGAAPLNEKQIERIVSCLDNNGAVGLLQALQPQPAPKAASAPPQQTQQLTASAVAQHIPPTYTSATVSERQAVQQAAAGQATSAEARAQGGYTHKEHEELVDMIKELGNELGLKVVAEYTLTRLRWVISRERRVDVAFFAGEYDESPIAIWEVHTKGNFEKDVNVFDEIRMEPAYKGAKLFYVVSSDSEYEDTVRYLNARGLGKYVIVVRPEDLKLVLELVKNRVVKRILAALLEEPAVQNKAFELWKSGSP